MVQGSIEIGNISPICIINVKDLNRYLKQIDSLNKTSQIWRFSLAPIMIMCLKTASFA